MSRANRPYRQAAGPMEPLNLARRPFRNRRPVTRVAILLWLLAAVLLVSNVLAYWRYLAGSEQVRAALADVRADRDQEEKRISDLERQLAGFDLERQNLQVTYLNQKIADRTFSWSRLLDQIARLLPNDVRLTRLVPEGIVETKRRNQRADKKLGEHGTEATLTIEGQTRSDEALLRFVDALYDDPAFAEPDLASESRNEDGTTRFTISVGYRPKVVALSAPSGPSAAASAVEGVR